MVLRFALGGISCECNGFAAGECDVAYFEQTGFMLAGDAMLQLRDTSAEIGGALDLLLKQQQGQPSTHDAIEPVLLLGARANSAAPLSNACWAELRGGLLARLRAAVDKAPLAGVMLAMHGNMCVGNTPGQPVDLDPEGTLAEDVRAIVGPSTLIVMTLDLHANVTPLMASHLDACISYDHYPHDDIFRTGQKAAWLMLRAARGEIKPALVCSKINMMQTALRGSTILRPDGSAIGPGGQMLLDAKQYEDPGMWDGPAFSDPWENKELRGSCHYGHTVEHIVGGMPGRHWPPPGHVLLTSLNFIHPHNDFPDMGNCATVRAAPTQKPRP